MAPPCGDAAAAAASQPSMASLGNGDGDGVQPPLGCGGGGGGNAAGSEEEMRRRKKKEKGGTPRITGWGLREFSKIVSRKVQAKGRTTYNEVADEIFAELKSMTLNGQEFDEKNIRRRVYDAFNVLIAIRVIAKDKKEIKWMGLPNTKSEKIKKLEEVRREIITRIKNKKTLLKEIEKQFDDLQNLKLRNQALQRSAESAQGIHLPFLLVKTSKRATVEIEISHDTQFVHFDFNGTPFTLHDDVSILEGIRCQGIRRADVATQSSLEGSKM